MHTIVLSTNNSHKVSELKSMISEVDIKIFTKSEYGVESFEVIEDELTLEGNALKKAKALFERTTGVICIADDTGLFVDALKGEPGIMSARYAGEEHDDKKNIELLLKNMTGVSDRKARFMTVIAIIDETGKEYLAKGICEGHISESPTGNSGFGYDPVFIPVGYDLSFAALGEDIKNRISHRRKAYDNLVKIINDIGER